MGTALLVSLQDLRLETTTSTLSSSLVKANEELTYLALRQPDQAGQPPVAG